MSAVVNSTSFGCDREPSLAALSQRGSSISARPTSSVDRACPREPPFNEARKEEHEDSPDSFQTPDASIRGATRAHPVSIIRDISEKSSKNEEASRPEYVFGSKSESTRLMLALASAMTRRAVSFEPVRCGSLPGFVDPAAPALPAPPAPSAPPAAPAAPAPSAPLAPPAAPAWGCRSPVVMASGQHDGVTFRIAAGNQDGPGAEGFKSMRVVVVQKRSLLPP